MDLDGQAILRTIFNDAIRGQARNSDARYMWMGETFTYIAENGHVFSVTLAHICEQMRAKGK